MTFSANLGFLWPELALPDAIRAAAAAGFAAVELHWPYDTDPESVRTALAETGLPLLSLNTRRGDVDAGEFGLSALPHAKDRARAAIDEAFERAARLGARSVHVMAGKAQGDTARETFVENLRHAADLGARCGVGVLIEPLNPFDVPGYFLIDPDAAAAIIRDTGRDNIRILFDCYHLARNGIDPLHCFRRHRPLVGHVQFAALPDRTEPDHGPVDYARLLPQLAEEGYTGMFGAEYRPRGRTADGLGWLSTLTAPPRSLRPLRPADIAPPLANYNHGMLIRAGADLVFCSGQLGITADGHIPDTVEEQAEICFRNIAAILADAGMSLSDIARLNAYVTAREDMAGYMRIRDRLFAQPAPASTLMIVGGFTRPEFRVEIEAVAARRPDR